MKLFVKLEVEKYTLEGLEMAEYDKKTADSEHTQWIVEYLDPSQIIRFAPSVEKPETTFVGLANGDAFTVNIHPNKFYNYVKQECESSVVAWRI